MKKEKNSKKIEIPKKRKYTRRIIISISVIALLSGIFLIIVNIPDKEIQLSPGSNINFGFYLGIFLLLLGIILILSLESRLKKIKLKLSQDLKSGKVGKYDDLRRYAGQLGLELRDLGNGHTGVYVPNTSNRITEIPSHSSGTATGTYRDVLRKLRNYAASAA